MSVSVPSVPHFAFPFQFNADAGAAVLEQDSYGEILACVAAITFCQIGSCPELPTFGIPDPTFSDPIDGQAVAAALAYWEPRADENVTSQAIDMAAGEWQMNVGATVAGTSL